ncbi:MAG: ECF transporter S component [Actinomycetes bacterium]|nr:ECF transporter S component [Actinomycetes bacterium]MDX5380074.1 ECF transporter S component [Actinomycetes bacterium]MDX5398652.1 ECF transporter S component [Actinomycetes bacterium]MDX5449787.1 ECF transporter S component [Actinomycetes bacterium]
MTTTETTTAAPRAGRYVLASRPLLRWRTVDILTVTFLGVALGIAMWGWGILYNGPLTALGFTFRPAMGLFVGMWFIGGVVGGLIVRRPGAALACEVVAALASMLPGTEWGATVLIAGILQGLGAELGFAIFRYRSWGVVAAVTAGALSAPLEWLYEITTWFADWGLEWKLVYLPMMVLSGAVIAGLGGLALVRALAGAGALDAFPPGQERREAHAV